MLTPNIDLMKQARESLKGNWNIAVGGAAIVFLMGALGAIPYAGAVVSILLSGPLMIGYALFFLSITRKKEIRIATLFDGFSHFGNAFVTYLLFIIFIILWTLLLIVPGIIAGIRYSQTFFILADDPTISATEAINKSKAMMEGNKWKFFCLCCRFIGWAILGIITLGIGFLWIYPYIMTSLARFYDDLNA